MSGATAPKSEDRLKQLQPDDRTEGLVFQQSACMYVYLRFQGTSTSQVIDACNEMIMDDYDGQMIFGDIVGPKLPDIHLTSEEKP